MFKTSTYYSWSNMKKRCRDKKHMSYEKYGGAGIDVCKRWEKFENFLADMGEKPEGKQSIGRINNLKGYFKENCQWEDYFQQNSNTSKNKYISFDERTMVLPEWARLLNVSRHTLYYRVKSWGVSKALLVSGYKQNI